MGETSGPVNNPLTWLTLEVLENSVEPSHLNLRTRTIYYSLSILTFLTYKIVELGGRKYESVTKPHYLLPVLYRYSIYNSLSNKYEGVCYKLIPIGLHFML